MYTKNEIRQLWIPDFTFKPKPFFIGFILISSLLLLFSYFFPFLFVTSFPLWWLSLLFIVGQPLAEEYVFRHLLQKIIFLKLLPSKLNFKPSKAYSFGVIIVTSLFFVAIHSKTNVFLFIWVFIASLIYGFSYYYSDSLTNSWLLHATNNFLGFAL